MNIDLADFVKNKCFNRYPSKTDVIAKQLLDLKSTMLDDFNDSIYDVFEQRLEGTGRSDVIPAVIMQREYRYFMEGHKYKLSTSFDSELETKAFVR